MMYTLLVDLRHSVRVLRRAPAFVLAVVMVLALGIGSNSALFSALDQTVIRPLAYADPERLVMLWEDFSAFGVPKNRVSPATFLDWKRRTRALEQAAAYAGPRNMDLSGSGPPEEVLGLSVSANLLPLLGVQPLLGRTFSTNEEGPDAKLTVLSYRLWQRRFGGDPRLVGRSIVMNNEHYSVIGVMPRGFMYPDRDTELWIPLGLFPQLTARRNSHFLKVLGRIRPGLTLAQAQADLGDIARQLEKDFAATNAKVGVTVAPLKEEMLGNSRLAFLILLAAAVCVLLIACTNVANMLLARVDGRRGEMAIRTALGASRARLLRQVLTENLFLSLLAGMLGLLFARWTLRALGPMVPSGLPPLRIDARMLAFSVAASALTALLSGFAPALELARVDLTGRGIIGGGSKLRDVLIIAEIAIALVLSVGAVLLMETLAHLRAVDAGFRAEHLLTAEVTVSYPKYVDSGKRRRFYGDLLRRVRAIPGVERAGLTSDLPYTSRGNTMSLSVSGSPTEPGLQQDALFRLVSAGYLETIGARLTQGRFLEERDAVDASPVVVVSESLARRYWAGESALGHRIDTGTGDGTPLWMTIVGVISDIRERGLDLGLKPAVYVPFTQTSISFFLPSEIAVRTSREPLRLATELQQAVWSIDREQPVARIRTMAEIVDGELEGRTRVLALLGAFAGLALMLAALGIYGVLSYVVSQKTREIGLRMAIGASRWDVMRTVAGFSARLTAGGLAVGILVTMLVSRLLASLLYEVSPLDPGSFALVTAGLAVVALLASYLPVRRAASVDPLTALRSE